MDLFTFSEKFVNPILNVFKNLPEALLTLGVGIIAVEILVKILDKVLSRKKLRPFKDFLLSIFKFVLRSALILFFLNSLGFSRLASVITGSTAILVFVLSAGASQFIADIIAGLSLAADNDFKLSSRLKAGDKDTIGILKSTDMRKVRIVDDEGNVHVIPNSLVEKNEWIVFNDKD
ncbi:TPA: hypothetical protein DDW69_00325 [candidate division CPR2 bacterium]|uniref:Mechanosensitive ion channel MscS domain-containing protein n=1 Tax=candidate division CPR2 bacterium GW2011_GWC1_41_48 TaxID=1618344 RepID=A0A0G0W6U9_UNCC2|nr:MAG: hypothetical protein UT47_C0005G0005 [candidate division CPR2 bacterium GW2011_GWC2_39_35]KKR28172.1 MAG: hypothetical protein UT60_C0026G0003 [candidate division CPR2 bacterium GW2011_GWD2_39_7]KKS08694.1 MAG: hypothetical protein UU65_C0005G0005 [candidate division CPR2 bacterium GW2011_GWC1_41_48]OGB72283.1 MAG: hypothetical protein A2Y26_03460 [candidate division CPR2 bacterium GWD2_39_7]HBG81269.1 hypothetical protein [candidate division CPR2 bacterium]